MNKVDFYNYYIYHHTTLIVIQVTDSCNCDCKYCYQTNKAHSFMSMDTTHKIVDYLLTMYEEDNKQAILNKNTEFIAFEFIGGEPLLNYKAIDEFCSYFLKRCLELNNELYDHWSAFFICNGTQYFKPEVQQMFHKWAKFLHPSISLDGIKEAHDTNRLLKTGEPSYKEVYSAYIDLKEHITEYLVPTWITKMVLVPNNIQYLYDSFLFFVKDGIQVINMAFDLASKWSNKDILLYYKELKKCADYMIEHPGLRFSLINPYVLPHAIDLKQPCGCDFSHKLAFSWDGTITPCMQFYGTSLEEAYCVGTLNTPIDYNNPVYQPMYPTEMYTKECQNCPIGANCFTCIASSYKQNNKLVKDMNICPIYKVTAIIDYYYYNSIKNDYQKMPLPDQDIKQLITESEFELLRQNKKI